MAKNKSSQPLDVQPADEITRMVDEAVQHAPPVHDPDGLPPDAEADMESERLRRELAERDAQLAELRGELARRDAAAAPLPDDGPGEYEVILRHAPSRLKRWRGFASSANEAWSQFVQAALKKAYNAQDTKKLAMKAFERFVREGRTTGFDRVVRKLKPAEAPAA